MNFEEWRKSIGLKSFPATNAACRITWDAATKAERERCAAICDEVISDMSPYASDECAYAIKAKILKGE
jgi:hypothetical protein